LRSDIVLIKSFPSSHLYKLLSDNKTNLAARQ